MANTLGTVNGTLVAQQTLESLLTMFPVLKLIATDFSPSTALYNQQVVSRVVQPTTAGDYNTSTGYVSTDRAVVDVPVTINQHIFHQYDVNDQERSSTNRDLLAEWSQTAAHSLGKRMVDDLIGVINANATSFPTGNRTNFANAAAFTYSSVVDIRAALNKRFVPDMGRFMLLNSDFASSLHKDSTVIANYANPASTVIDSGKLVRVHGFDIAEYAALTGGTLHIAGFAGNREALVMACRVPEAPSTDLPLGGTIDVVTEPNSGLSIQLRQNYDFQKGREFRTMTLMYGVAPGFDTTGSPATANKIQLITYT